MCGAHHIKIKDVAGNVSTTSVTIAVDQTPPTIKSSSKTQYSTSYTVTTDEKIKEYIKDNGYTWITIEPEMSFTIDDLSIGRNNIKGKDIAGNPSITGVVVTIDQTAPTIIAEITSSNINSERAELGDTITLTLIASEELVNAPVVTIIGNEVTMIRRGINYVATYTVTENDINGNIKINVSNYSDLAGNAGLDLINVEVGNVVIREEIPTLTVETASNNINERYANLSDTIVLTITVSEMLVSEPTVTVAEKRVVVTGDGLNYTATYTVSETDVDGPINIRISEDRDIAGNKGIDLTVPLTDTVVIDRRAPTVY